MSKKCREARKKRHKTLEQKRQEEEEKRICEQTALHRKLKSQKADSCNCENGKKL